MNSDTLTLEAETYIAIAAARLAAAAELDPALAIAVAQLDSLGSALAQLRKDSNQ